MAYGPSSAASDRRLRPGAPRSTIGVSKPRGGWRALIGCVASDGRRAPRRGGSRVALLEIAARSAVVRSTEGSILGRETDRGQVPRGKVEKDSEERVKENAKPSWTNGENVSASRHPLRPRPVPWRLARGALEPAVRRCDDRIPKSGPLTGARSLVPAFTGRAGDAPRAEGRRMEGGGRSSASRLSPLTTRLETRTEESNACASSETRKCQGKAERRRSREAPAVCSAGRRSDVGGPRRPPDEAQTKGPERW